MRKAFILIVVALFLTSCGGWWSQGYTEELLEDFKMERLRDGYEVALTAVRDWSPEAYLGAATGMYRLEPGGWRIQRGYYIFVDKTRMQYIGITVDLERRRLVVYPPGKVGGKGSIVTTGHFNLLENQVDDLHAIAIAFKHLPADCKVQEVIIAGHGDISQSWWVDFKNPHHDLWSPLFLPTIFVNAITGAVKLSSEWEEEDWCQQ